MFPGMDIGKTWNHTESCESRVLWDGGKEGIPDWLCSSM